jgi:hypothetical protein
VPRIQIRLTEEQSRFLREIADEEGVSLAEVVRRSVEAMIRNHHGISLEERRRRALALAGRFHSGVPDLAAHHDNYFAEACEDKDDEEGQ